MGCVSSKLLAKDPKREILLVNGGSSNHVVSLTSSTLGVLKLDNEQPMKESATIGSKNSPPREAHEIINALELMKDLEDGMPISIQARKSPKPRAFLRGFQDLDRRSPLKFLNHTSSPKKGRRASGKENKSGINGVNEYGSPIGVLKACSPSENSKKKTFSGTRISTKGSPMKASPRVRNLSPIFDPDLVASLEKELSEEEEQIKTMVSSTPKIRNPRNFKNCESILSLFEEKCPPGGENAVVVYTTTLRGIRKTFEDCNVVRSIIESNGVQMFERDISMDLGFKEELRRLMGTRGVKLPLVFVKGRLVGGADEMVKLEEEGKLGILFNGIPKAVFGCEGCAGVRFVMCMGCNGSCKVLDVNEKKTVRCGQCNENGLIQCPICC